MCEEAQAAACDWVTDTPCDQVCANYGIVTEGCPGVLEAGFGCLQDLPDICDLTGCEEENEAFAECHAAYCDPRPDDPACQR